MTDYVFAYGSLLSPASLARTLPNTRLTDVVGARLTGFVRTFDVAFPNDGSQGDKAYFDPSGGRPSHVLFANVVASSAGEAVNGVLVPMGPGDIALLVNRERLRVVGGDGFGATHGRTRGPRRHGVRVRRAG